MPPEQLPGDAPAEAYVRIDIYAVGVLMYKLLTGKTPFSAATLTDPRAERRAAPPSARLGAPLPPGVDELVLQALAADPDRRFPSCAALIAAIKAVPAGDLAAADELPTRTHHPRSTAPRDRAAPRPRWPLAAAMLASVAGLTALVIEVKDPRSSSASASTGNEPAVTSIPPPAAAPSEPPAPATPPPRDVLEAPPSPSAAPSAPAARDPPAPVPGLARPPAPLAAKQVEQAFARSRAIRGCWHGEAELEPAFILDISAAGQATCKQQEELEFTDHELTKCVLRQLGRLRFPSAPAASSFRIAPRAAAGAVTAQRDG
jgi:serine/threonine-protein kinase